MPAHPWGAAATELPISMKSTPIIGGTGTHARAASSAAGGASSATGGAPSPSTIVEPQQLELPQQLERLVLRMVALTAQCRQAWIMLLHTVVLRRSPQRRDVEAWPLASCQWLLNHWLGHLLLGPHAARSVMGRTRLTPGVDRLALATLRAERALALSRPWSRRSWRWRPCCVDAGLLGAQKSGLKKRRSVHQL